MLIFIPFCGKIKKYCRVFCSSLQYVESFLPKGIKNLDISTITEKISVLREISPKSYNTHFLGVLYMDILESYQLAESDLFLSLAKIDQKKYQPGILNLKRNKFSGGFLFDNYQDAFSCFQHLIENYQKSISIKKVEDFTFGYKGKKR